MSKKLIFDQDAAFKSIVGLGTPEPDETMPVNTNPAAPPQIKETQKVTKETKKRVNLAIYPGIYNDLQKIAYVNRQSVSDIVTKLISEYVEANADKLNEYDRIAGNQ